MAKTTSDFIKGDKDYTIDEMPDAISEALQQQFKDAYKEGTILVLEDSNDFKNYIGVFDTLMKPKISAFAKLNDRNGAMVFTQAFKGDISKENHDLFLSCLAQGTPQYKWGERKGYYMFPAINKAIVKGVRFFQMAVVMMPLPQ